MRCGETMERYAWKASVAEGKQEEYKRRHNELWPEMEAALKQAGIRNYSIWLCGRELFGYYECSLGKAHSSAIQAQSEVVRRWSEYMSDILIFENDPSTGERRSLKEVFYLD